MKDLFGNDMEYKEPPKYKSEAFPKENPMVVAFGEHWEPDTKCKTCANLWEKKLVHTYYKCKLRAYSSGKHTDHKKNWTACSKYVKSTTPL